MSKTWRPAETVSCGYADSTIINAKQKDFEIYWKNCQTNPQKQKIKVWGRTEINPKNFRWYKLWQTNDECSITVENGYFCTWCGQQIPVLPVISGKSYYHYCERWNWKEEI